MFFRTVRDSIETDTVHQQSRKPLITMTDPELHAMNAEFSAIFRGSFRITSEYNRRGKNDWYYFRIGGI